VQNTDVAENEGQREKENMAADIRAVEIAMPIERDTRCALRDYTIALYYYCTTLCRESLVLGNVCRARARGQNSNAVTELTLKFRVTAIIVIIKLIVHKLARNC
jgi:hypothetical protein